MDFASIKKVVGFYGRFLVSFSAIGYRARALTGSRCPPISRVRPGSSPARPRHRSRSPRRRDARGATVLALARSREKLDALARVHRVRAASFRSSTISRSVADTQRLPRILAQGSRVTCWSTTWGCCSTISTTAEGFETSYATNLLTHWVLTEPCCRARRSHRKRRSSRCPPAACTTRR
jgi:hypothetical protein